MLRIFKKKPALQPQEPEEHILSEEKPLSEWDRTFSFEKKKITPPLTGFEYIAESHTEENKFFDNVSDSARAYTHNTNKVGLRITIKMPGQNVQASFEFDSAILPEVARITHTRVQSISCGFGTPNTADYKEVKRFKREIMTREYSIMGASLVDYLRSNTHLSSVSDFLKLYEASSKTCTRDIPIQLSCGPSGPK